MAHTYENNEIWKAFHPNEDFDAWLAWRLKVDAGETKMQSTLIIRPDVAYESPTTGHVITSEKARRNDLAASGCIEYDPEMKTDQARRIAAQDAKLDKEFDVSIDKAIESLSPDKKAKLEVEMASGLDVDVVRTTVQEIKMSGGDIDINSLVDSVADGMNLEGGDDEKQVVVDDKTENQEVQGDENEDDAIETEIPDDENTEEVVEEEAETEAPIVREAPKSWAKEQHEVWAKLPPEAQNYIEHREKQMLDGIEEYKEFAHYGRELNNVIAPYSPMFEQAGVDIKTGVQFLLNAQYLLQAGTPQQKETELRRIAQQYGVNLGEKPAGSEEKLDPRLEQMQNTINNLQKAIQSSQQHTLTEVRAKTQAEVKNFADDGNHPYFDELADEIAIQIRAGKSLQDAYDTAVYANPVTRTKEIARIQTENAAKLREKKQQEAEKAKKAISSNVRTIDTTRTPTEKKGKLFSNDFDTEMLEIAKKGLSATN